MALFEPVESRQPLKGQLVWFASWVGITAVGLAMTPDPTGHGTHQHLGLPPCPSVLLFDRPCPGCGLTTSWTALLHGHIAEAFAAHPLGPPLYAVFTAIALTNGAGYFRRIRVDSTGTKVGTTLAYLAAAFVLFGVVRFAITPHYGTQSEHWFARLLVPRS